MANWFGIAQGVLGLAAGNKAAKAQSTAAAEAAMYAEQGRRSSAEAVREAENKALLRQDEMLRETRKDLDPWRTSGLRALYDYNYQRTGAMPTADEIAQLYRVDESALQPKRDELFLMEDKLKAYERLGTTLPPAEMSQLAALRNEVQLGEAELKQQLDAKVAGGWNPSNLADSPMYRQEVEDTTEALNRQLLARGLYGGGSGAKIQADTQRRLAMGEAEAQYGRLQGLSQQGQNAATGMAGATGNASGQATNIIMGGVPITAQGYTDVANMRGQAAQIGGMGQADMWKNLGNVVLNTNWGGFRSPQAAPATSSANTGLSLPPTSIQYPGRLWS